MDYADYQYILFERRDPGILWLTFNRPERLNAVNDRMHVEIGQVWKTIDSDPSVRAVVVTGAGRGFSAGGDFQLIEDAHANYERIIELVDETRDLVYNIIHFSKPVVSAINGPAVGAGLVVALLADISIAGESATLGDGHIRLGVAAGDHAAILWPLLVGMAKAKYYLLTGELLKAPEAERIGLISQCVPDDELLDRAMAVATTLAEGPRHAIKFTKRALNQWLLQAGPIFDHSVAVEMLGFFSEDVMAGVEGLRNREKPDFPSNKA